LIVELTRNIRIIHFVTFHHVRVLIGRQIVTKPSVQCEIIFGFYLLTAIDDDESGTPFIDALGLDYEFDCMSLRGLGKPRVQGGFAVRSSRRAIRWIQHWNAFDLSGPTVGRIGGSWRATILAACAVSSTRMRRQRVDRLLREPALLRQATDIRSYVEAVRERARDERSALAPDALEQWARWALVQADRIDPVTTGRSVSGGRRRGDGGQRRTRITGVRCGVKFFDVNYLLKSYTWA
jgi:hypothetical protein